LRTLGGGVVLVLIGLVRGADRVARTGGPLRHHGGRVHRLQVLHSTRVLLLRLLLMLMLRVVGVLLLPPCGRRGGGHVAVGQVAQRRARARHAALQILQQQICTLRFCHKKQNKLLNFGQVDAFIEFKIEKALFKLAKIGARSFRVQKSIKIHALEGNN